MALNTSRAAHNAAPHRVSEGTLSAQLLNKSMTNDPHLLDPDAVKLAAPRRNAPPLRLIRRSDAGPSCGFGTCSLDPACTDRCRYREADQALRSHYTPRHTQRAAMPDINRRRLTSDTDHKARRLVAIGIVIWFIAAIAFAGWAATS